MSKTLGNVVDPVEQVEKYGLDVKNEFFTEGMFEDETFDDDFIRKVDTVYEFNK